MQSAPTKKWTLTLGYYIVPFFFFSAGFVALAAVIELHNAGLPVWLIIPGFAFGAFYALVEHALRAAPETAYILDRGKLAALCIRHHPALGHSRACASIV